MRSMKDHEFRDGHLMVAGKRATELAETYGTPLLAIDFDVFDAAIRLFKEAAQPHGIEIAYAGKALLLVAIARHLDAAGIHIDVASLGELMTAERAGIAPAHITLHGAAKTDEELDAALDGRVGKLVIDNLDELDAVIRRAARRERVDTRLVLRLNTGIEAHTHDFVRTSGDKTKFGLSEEHAFEAARRLQAVPKLRLAGLHSHIGSQIFEAAAFVENAKTLADYAARMSAAGASIEQIIVGGGFGVPMSPDDGDALDVAATLEQIAAAVKRVSSEAGIAPPRIGIEPGRALIAQAGTSLYRVMAVKEQFGRPYVIVDGSLADNPRPALYGAYHHPFMATAHAGALRETVVSGRSCENDQLAVAPLPDDVRAGDILATSSTGAYTYSMASNYNRFPKPAVVAVSGDGARLIARRETTQEVLRLDCDA